MFLVLVLGSGCVAATQEIVCRSATKSKHCPRGRPILGVWLSNKGVNEEPFSALDQ